MQLTWMLVSLGDQLALVETNNLCHLYIIWFQHSACKDLEARIASKAWYYIFYIVHLNILNYYYTLLQTKQQLGNIHTNKSNFICADDICCCTSLSLTICLIVQFYLLPFQDEYHCYYPVTLARGCVVISRSQFDLFFGGKSRSGSSEGDAVDYGKQCEYLCIVCHRILIEHRMFSLQKISKAK